MAIDTENKRRSAASHVAATTYPAPGGGINKEDRVHVSWLYRDINPGGPTAEGRGGHFIIGMFGEPGGID